MIAALGLVATLVLVTDPPGDDIAAEDTSSTAATVPDGLPEGVMPYSVAEELGTVEDIDWGERCDAETGVLALPLSPAPECFAPYDGPAGGASSPGVTADAIEVVLYLPQPNDPILSFIYDQIGLTDTNDDVIESYQRFIDMYEQYFETYGRSVELIPYVATGTAVDPVAATTDAETIARDIQPFMVLGGPAFGNAFADTLAANQVMCSGCTQATQAQFYIDRAPYVWSVTSNRDQASILTSEYIGRRLAGRPAEYGGDDVRDRERVFGYIHVTTLDVEPELLKQFEEQLGAYGVTLADVAGYDDPLSLAGQAREILARMKDRGVTTIVFRGDPLAPQTLTEQATQQGYFPEWVLAGSLLVDSTIFGRTYDQQQWSHAFGGAGDPSVHPWRQVFERLQASMLASLMQSTHQLRWFHPKWLDREGDWRSMTQNRHKSQLWNGAGNTASLSGERSPVGATDATRASG